MKLKYIFLMLILSEAGMAQDGAGGEENASSLGISKETIENLGKLVDANAAAKSLEESSRKNGVEAVRLDKGILFGIADKKEDQGKMREFLEELKDAKNGDFIKLGDYLVGGELVTTGNLSKGFDELNAKIAALTSEVANLKSQNANLKNQEAKLNGELSTAYASIRSLREIIRSMETKVKD